MNTLLVKVCGLRDGQNAAMIAALGVNYLGFVFVPASPRNAEGTIRAAQLTPLSEMAATVVVVKDRPLVDVARILSGYPFSAIQLHGKEPPEYCNTLRHRYPGCQIIKSWSIDAETDFAFADQYAEAVDYLLLDSRSPLGGGSGKKFDWSLLSNMRRDVPFFLSGGIGIEDVEEVRQAAHKYPGLRGVDLNSRFETEPGMKNVKLIARFVKDLRA